jgi:uncharacterized protein (TIGR02246 family)
MSDTDTLEEEGAGMSLREYVRRDQRWNPGVWFVATMLAAILAISSSDFAAGARESDDRTADNAAIRKILSEQQAAWNRGDVNSFLEGYWHSPKLTFSGSSGVARGWDGVLARYKKNYPNLAAMGQLEFSDLEFRFLGRDAALVLGGWHLTREKEGNIGGVFSLVWQKFPEGWRIIHDHTSAVAPQK